jgi:DNA-binding transcriptional regulator PaaX
VARWLLLIHQLPPKPDYLRVKMRRRLSRFGAAQLKSTVYVLPNVPESLEDGVRGEVRRGRQR